MIAYKKRTFYSFIFNSDSFNPKHTLFLHYAAINCLISFFKSLQYSAYTRSVISLHIPKFIIPRTDFTSVYPASLAISFIFNLDVVNSSFTETALAIGYTDVKSFSKMFYKTYGILPSKARKEYLDILLF